MISVPDAWQLPRIPGTSPSAQMASTSSAGASAITLQFDLAITLDVAEQQVIELAPVEVWGDAVRVLQMGYIRTELIKHQRFVIDGTGIGAVAPAEKGDSRSVLAKPLGDKGREGSLAGSSRCQIADTHDGD